MQQDYQLASFLFPGQDASKLAQPRSSLPFNPDGDQCASEHRLGAHPSLQQQLKACSQAEASSSMTGQQGAAAASIPTLLPICSAQEPAQSRDKAGAEAADLPACDLPQQSGIAKPEHAAFRSMTGDMPVRWCAQQQLY